MIDSRPQLHSGGHLELPEFDEWKLQHTGGVFIARTFADLVAKIFERWGETNGLIVEVE